MSSDLSAPGNNDVTLGEVYRGLLGLQGQMGELRTMLENRVVWLDRYIADQKHFASDIIELKERMDKGESSRRNLVYGVVSALAGSVVSIFGLIVFHVH